MPRVHHEDGDAPSTWLEPEPLLHLFRALCGSSDLTRLRALDETTWEELVRRVTAHGLLPAFAELLAGTPDAGGPDLPEPLLASIRTRQRRAALHHLAGQATLADVRCILKSSSIPFVILKGPALASRLYGRKPLRRYVDVDVWVRPGDRDRAIEALGQDIFEHRSGAFARWLVRRGHFHAVLHPRQKQRLKVELHWALVDRANLTRLEEPKIFDRRRTIFPDGSPGDRDREGGIPVMALEDELVYLAIHLAKHGVLNGWGWRTGQPAEWFCDPTTGNSLGWFLDIHAYLRRFAGALDWAAMRRRAERWNVLDEVGETLGILERLAADGVARQALQALEVPEIEVRRDGGAVDRSRLGGRLWQRALTMNAEVAVRPVRLLLFGRTLFPSPARLLAYHAEARWRWLPWLYLRHPFHVLGRTLGL